MKVAVIGAGISGLSTAFRLKAAGADVTVFEGSDYAGGNIRTVREGGFLVENGPNSLLTNNEILDLVNDLKLAGEIAKPKPEAKKRYIVRGGRLVALPSGPADIFTTKALSVSGRLRLFKEPFISPATTSDESAADFFERRLGKELTDYAVDPFISGIYAGDPHRLSIKSAFPKLYKFEHEAGSIVKGALFSPKEKTKKLPKDAPRSFSFKNGMSTLTGALSARLGDSLRLGTPVGSIVLTDDAYAIATNDSTSTYDAVVISTPARSAAALIRDLDERLAGELEGIYYPPIAVVYSAFRRDQVNIEPAGFGALVPAAENKRILGCMFSSSLFEGRAPADTHLFTTFVGGSRNSDLCSLSEAELIGLAIEEIRPLLDIRGDAVFTGIKKWERSIPQYNIGYEKVPAAIESFRTRHRGIFFCSNFYKGISVGECIKNSVETAAEVLRVGQ